MILAWLWRLNFGFATRRYEIARSNPTLAFKFQRNKTFLLRSLVKIHIVGSLCAREIACKASDRQGPHFESYVWRAVSSHHRQKVLPAQFSLYVHNSSISFLFFMTYEIEASNVDVVLAHRLWHWNNIAPWLFRRLVFVGTLAQH